MKLSVLDANSVKQSILVKAQEAPNDKSGTIAATSVAQVALDANALRAGWLLQNVGANAMYINDAGDAAAGAGSFKVSPGEFFPPAGYPVTVSAISIFGTAGDAFSAREW